MAIKLIRSLIVKGRLLPPGTILEHPKAESLIQKGTAEEVLPEVVEEAEDVPSGDQTADTIDTQPGDLQDEVVDGQGQEDGEGDRHPAGSGEGDSADTEEDDTEGAEGDPLADLAAEAAAAAAEGAGEAPKGDASGGTRRARKGGTKGSKE